MSNIKKQTDGNESNPQSVESHKTKSVKSHLAQKPAVSTRHTEKPAGVTFSSRVFKKTPITSRGQWNKNVARHKSDFKIISPLESVDPSLHKGAKRFSMGRTEAGGHADVKWESDLNADDDDLKVLEVIIQPSNYRHSTIKPLAQMAVAVACVAGSIGVFPWIQYVVLQETLHDNAIYESHVSTGLFTECREDEQGEEACRELGAGGDSPFYITLVGLGVGVTMACVGVVAAMAQAASSYYGETSEDPDTYKPIPSLMPLEFLASLSTWLSAITLSITIIATKYSVGGSAGLGIFLCGVGVSFMMSAAWEAWGVALAPARAGTPWVIKVKTEDGSTTEEDVTPDASTSNISIFNPNETNTKKARFD